MLTSFIPILMTIILGASASVASAASWNATYNAGDFSAYVAGPSVGWVDDCKVEVGPVVDSIPRPDYRKIGGVRVNCSSVHAVIKATVWEQYSNGSAWVNWGYSNIGVRYNQAGSGNGILKSPGVCSPNRSNIYAWRTVALVQTERVGSYLYSVWAKDPSGC